MKMKTGLGNPGWTAALLLLVATLIPAGPKYAVAAELVVFDAEDCAVSQQFHREIPSDYGKTRAGRVLPMRRVDVEKGDPTIVLMRKVTLTPTFVFVDKGREIARVTGYPGRDLFLRIVDEAADALLKNESSM